MISEEASKAPRTTSILGVAAIACVACCIGPILALVGAVAALGLVSTIFIGAAALVAAAAVTVAALLIGRRRLAAGGAVVPVPVPVDLSRRVAGAAGGADVHDVADPDPAAGSAHRGRQEASE